MNARPITLRALEPGDHTGWRRLYDGYAVFYHRPMNDRIAAVTWGWLIEPAHPLEGLVAERGGTLIGLAHYRAMPSPLRGAEIGFLDDLFVAPEARGQHLGLQLIEAVAAVGRERGWPVIRWLTADDNYRARTLYDRVAMKTGWNLYELDPGDPRLTSGGER